MSPVDFDIVIPTVGRPSLAALIESLERSRGPLPGRVWVVNDRSQGPSMEGLVRRSGQLAGRISVVAGRGAGPAAARNAGWRRSTAEWVAFLDDDVVLPLDWLERLTGDLERVGPGVAAVQGRLTVPRPQGRNPTDWERNTIALEDARFATADMAYRRTVLEKVGGFDERFPRAYREDADLALRCMDAGYSITVGSRQVIHPVRPAGRWASVKAQRGNADDALMDALHGLDWRSRAVAPRGARRRHLATSAFAAASLAAAGLGRPRAAAATAGLWAALTADFARKRIVPGPRTAREIATIVATSVAIPLAATFHWIRGLLRARRISGPSSERPRAVFVDRDGTLIRDVPYNGDPELVELMPGAVKAIQRLREAQIPTAVISNQSGVARGLLSLDQVSAVNERVERELGPLGPWFICTHAPDDACECRKPAPGLLLKAAEALKVPVTECVFIGDIGSDVEAAKAAGARPILVPTPVTRPEEIESAEEVAPDLEAAVDLVLAPTTAATARKKRRTP